MLDLERSFIGPELEISVLFPGAKDLIRKLSKRYRLFILSNNVSGELVHSILRKGGIGKYFERVFVSSEIGFRKPQMIFIEHVMKELNARPEDCIMVGDRISQDISMAEKAGIRSVLVSLRHHEDNADAREEGFDHKVNSLEELGKLLL